MMAEKVAGLTVALSLFGCHVDYLGAEACSAPNWIPASPGGNMTGASRTVRKVRCNLCLMI